MKNILSSLFAFAIGGLIFYWSSSLLNDGQQWAVSQVIRLLVELGFIVGFVILAKKNQKLKAMLAKTGIPESELK